VSNGNSRIVGFDSRRFVRKDFEALMGVGVTVVDYDAFVNSYTAWIKELFSNAGFQQNKLIYKSFDLNKLFGNQIDTVYASFVDAVKNDIQFLDVYYSYFYPPDKHQIPESGILDEKEEREQEHLEFIKVYYKESTGSEYVSGIKFLNLIEHAYPLICVWDYAKRNMKFSSNIYVDHFETKPSHVWEDLIANKEKVKMNIIYNGDRCNYLISTADILTAYLHDEIKKQNIFLNRQVHKILHNGFSGKFETRFLGSKYLYDIAPSNKYVVNNLPFLKHPVYFVFGEGNEDFKKTYPNTEEKKFLEDSPFMNEIYNQATRNNGSVKYYDPNTDNQIIQKQDKFFRYGPNGQNKIEYLKKVGYKNEIISIETLLKEKE
jgi:hypothetical protein